VLEKSKRKLTELFKEKEDMLHEKLKENRIAATQKGIHIYYVHSYLYINLLMDIDTHLCYMIHVYESVYVYTLHEK
jgi:hypothetical protein